MEYELKRILSSGIEAALQKADKYRELNQPAEASSICLDVLAIEPGHQLALRILGLALTDQFEPHSGARFAEARRAFARLVDSYERAFYGGLAIERQAKAQLTGHLPVGAIRPLLEQALTCYGEAEALRPAGNDDAILRWNSCVRTLEKSDPDALATEPREVDWETDFVPHRR